MSQLSCYIKSLSKLLLKSYVFLKSQHQCFGSTRSQVRILSPRLSKTKSQTAFPSCLFYFVSSLIFRFAPPVAPPELQLAITCTYWCSFCPSSRTLSPGLISPSYNPQQAHHYICTLQLFLLSRRQLQFFDLASFNSYF